MWGRLHTCICQRVYCCNMPGDQIRIKFGSFFFFLSLFFHSDFIWLGYKGPAISYLLRLSCTVSWKPEGSFANILLACCWLLLLRWIQWFCFEYRPAHSWVELGCTLLQRGCGKRSDLQVAYCILYSFAILLDLVSDFDYSETRIKKMVIIVIVTTMTTMWRTWSKFNKQLTSAFVLPHELLPNLGNDKMMIPIIIIIIKTIRRSPIMIFMNILTSAMLTLNPMRFE